jgi:hypothetical protein
MISKEKHENAVKLTLEFFEKAGIVLTDKEKANIEVADFGLNRLEETGFKSLLMLIRKGAVPRSWFYSRIKPVRSTGIPQ